MGDVTVNRSRFYIGNLVLFIDLGEKKETIIYIWISLVLFMILPP